MAGKSSSTSRFRNFATVVYPESAPEHWIETLSEQCIPVFVSPLHDLDVNPDGEVKKAHYHVLFCFEGVKTAEQVRVVSDLIGGVGLEVVQSLRGYARYLCHLDNPEKHQYSPDDVLAFGGTDYHSTINLPTDKYKAIREMRDFIRDNGIEAYSDLFDYAADYREDWFRILCDSGTFAIKEYLKARTWKADRSTLSRDGLSGYRCNTPHGVLVEAAEYIGGSVELSDGQ